MSAGATFGIVENSKDSNVDGDGNMRSKNKDASLVITGSPTYYTTLADIPLLPMAALDVLDRLNFVTADGIAHNYHVDGVEVQSTYSVVFFPRNKELFFANSTIMFRTLDISGNLKSEIQVVEPAASKARRLQLLKSDYMGESATGISARCLNNGVCFHTYDEILEIGVLSEYQKQRYLASSGDEASYSNDESTPSYAIVNADIDILTKDSRSNLVSAQSFLEGILGNDAMFRSGDTVVVKFTMRERCVNYPELADTCLNTPVPDTTGGEGNVAAVTKLLQPFAGLTPDSSKWVFTDEIEYLQDDYSVCLKVRYAHDQKRESRRHVVLMDRTDTSKVWTYDEVTTMTDPYNIYHEFTQPTLFITNLKTENVDSDIEVSILLSSNLTIRHALFTCLLGYNAICWFIGRSELCA